jgi:hypothetical protein
MEVMARLTETVIVGCYGQTAEQFIIDPDWRDQFAAYQEAHAAKWAKINADLAPIRAANAAKFKEIK